MIGFAVFWLGAFALGWLLIRATRVPVHSRLELLAWSGGWGVGALAFLAFLLGSLGVRLGRGLVLLVCGGAVLAAGLTAALSRSGFGPRGASLRPRIPAEWIVLGGFAIVLCTLAVAIATTPLGAFDARMLWTLQARLIFDTEAYPSAELLDPAFVVAHPQYPPLLPLAEALSALAAGSFRERLVRLVPTFFYLSVVAALLAALARNDRRFGPLLAGVYALMPTLILDEHGGAADAGLADIPLSFFVLLSVLLLARAREAEWRDHAVAGHLAALAGLFKNEGLVLGALLVASVSFQARRSWRLPLAFAAGWALTLLPWLEVRSALPTVFEEQYGEHLNPSRILWGLDRAGAVLGEMLQLTFLRPNGAGLTWWVVGLFWLASPGRIARLRDVHLWVVPAYLAAIFVVYLITPWEGTLQVRLSFARVLLHVAPLALWAVGTGRRARA